MSKKKFGQRNSYNGEAMETYKTISEAWWFNLKKCYSQGVRTPIDRGSYEKELFRVQLETLSFCIESPLVDMVPIINPLLPPVITRKDA